MEATKEQIFLTHILAANVMIESLEELQQDDVYRQELKQVGNRFMQLIAKHCAGPTAAIWGNGLAADNSMYTLMNYQRKVVHLIATMKPEDIGIVMAMIEAYKAHPRKTLTRLQIKTVDSTEQS